jgi:dephospho-CoA kinase
MGKSTTAAMFAEEGAAVFDADAVVQALYAPGGAAVEPLKAAFPGVADAKTGVDKAKLSQALQADPSLFAKLESIVHPLVGEARAQFFADAEAAGTQVIILDVPLLFETGGHEKVDQIVVVSANPELQRQRVLARSGMSAEKFEAILAQQMPDHEKRERADFVILTDDGLDAAREQVRDVIFKIKVNSHG